MDTFDYLRVALQEFSDFQTPENTAKYKHLYNLPIPWPSLCEENLIWLQFNGFALKLKRDGTYTWEDTSGG